MEAPHEPKRVVCPASGLNEGVRCRDLAHHRQGEPDAEIGDVIGEHVRRVRDVDLAIACSGEIDGVGSDAVAGNDFQMRQRLDETPVCANIPPGDETADGRGVVRDDGCLLQ